MNSIEVNGISKSYNLGKLGAATLRESLQYAFTGRKHTEEFWALNDISFSLKPGETMGIIGKNGAGKSTLLKVLSKITKPTKGEAILRGRVSSLLEVGTGFHPELSGRENIFLNGSILGMSRPEIRQKFDEIVDFSGVEKFIDTPVKRYSSGMYVRLAFSVAAHLDPEILIIDEVLAVGDSDFQKKCLEKMDSVSAAGKSILFVSHNMSSIEKLCDRGIVLKSGNLDFEGSAKDAIDFYLNNQASLYKTQSIDKRTDREGEGRLTFTDVEVDSVRGSDVVRSGEDLTIKVTLRSNDASIMDPNVSIAISTEKGYQLADLSSKSNNHRLTFENGVVQLSCTLSKLPLNSGVYFFNLCAKSGSVIEDWIVHAGTFRVETADVFEGQLPDENQGALLLNQTWN